LHRLQVEEVLTIDVVQLGGVIGAGEPVAEFVFGTGKRQVIGFGRTGET